MGRKGRGGYCCDQGNVDLYIYFLIHLRGVVLIRQRDKYACYLLGYEEMMFVEC
jgi:hypothetical protein